MTANIARQLTSCAAHPAATVAAARQAGVSGYLVAHVRGPALVAAVRRVAAGGTAFAVYGGGTKGPDHVRHDSALLIHIDEDERPARIQDRRFFVPAYLGPKGWLGIDLDAPDIDWQEVTELLDASWRHAAPHRLIASIGG